MKNFVTYIPHGDNAELRKDTGQVPYQMHKICGYNSTLVTYFYGKKGRSGGIWETPPTDETIINESYPHLKTETPGLNMFFLSDKGRGKFYEKAFFEYLRHHAKNIDVLNLFHFGSETIFYCLLFKLLHRRGKVWVKLDIDISFYDSRKKFFNLGSNIPCIGAMIEKITLWLFFKSVTIITAEHTAGLNYFRNRFYRNGQKLHLMPNGVDSARILSLIGKVKSFTQKENIILTVGRIGNPQKNNELLMSSISDINLKDWKVYFVGPIEDRFQAKIDQYFKNNPHLTDKVFFTGAITNSSELYQYYNRSKVFCLTSRWEGFPLVACEAMFFGCFPVLSSNIPSALDFCEKGKTGQVFDAENTASLAKFLDCVINETKQIENSYNDIIQSSLNKFTWQKNIKKLIPLITDTHKLST